MIHSRFSFNNGSHRNLERDSTHLIHGTNSTARKCSRGPHYPPGCSGPRCFRKHGTICNTIRSRFECPGKSGRWRIHLYNGRNVPYVERGHQATSFPQRLPYRRIRESPAGCRPNSRYHLRPRIPQQKPEAEKATLPRKDFSSSYATPVDNKGYKYYLNPYGR